jgi:enediyne biosynthesis protein E4
MLRAFLLCCFIEALASSASAQLTIIKRDNGKFSTDYQTRKGEDCEMWEESIVLAPTGPCSVKMVYVFWTGDTPCDDTLWVVGDPAEGAYQPMSFVWSYNALIAPLIFHYNGTPHWDSVDVSSTGLHLDGYQRVWLQHRMKSGGAFIGLDNATSYSGSLIMNINGELIPGSGIPGSIDTIRGSLMARIGVTYDFPKGTGSEPAPKATMVDVTKTAGITDTTRLLKGQTRVAVVDWNGDGKDDIEISNYFFENKGDGTFSRRYDLGISAGGGAVWGDFDNDGKIDCYANNGGAGDRLYHNNGDGTFADVTATAGITNPYPTVTPMWFDYDRDGSLDLYIANGRTEAAGVEHYFPDQLWHNNGNGTFTNVTDAANLAAGEPDPYYDCWTASIGDYNNDRLPDVFVGTYRLAPDLLFRNNGDATFTNVAEETGAIGVPTAGENSYGHGAGSDFGDYDNDGNTDLIVGNLGHPDWRGLFSNPSLIYHNEGPPNYTFKEVHKELGLKFFEMNFGAMWLDVNNDGWLDLWHCQYAYNPSSSDAYRRSRLYLNSGPENKFKLQDVTWNTGPNIHGAWTASRIDYDNDGDMDIIAISPTENVKLFRNDLANKGNWIELRIAGDPTDRVNTNAYGTKTVTFAGDRKIYRELNSGGSGSTGTQYTNMIHIGLGNAAKADSIYIKYPNGKTRILRDVPASAVQAVPYSIAGLSVQAHSASERMELSNSSIEGRTLRFTLQAPERTTDLSLSLVDMTGRTVMHIVLPRANNGRVALTMGRALPSGTYLLRAVSKNAGASIKIAVLR